MTPALRAAATPAAAVATPAAATRRGTAGGGTAGGGTAGRLRRCHTAAPGPRRSSHTTQVPRSARQRVGLGLGFGGVASSKRGNADASELRSRFGGRKPLRGGGGEMQRDAAEVQRDAAEVPLEKRPYSDSLRQTT